MLMGTKLAASLRGDVAPVNAQQSAMSARCDAVLEGGATLRHVSRSAPLRAAGPGCVKTEVDV